MIAKYGIEGKLKLLPDGQGGAEDIKSAFTFDEEGLSLKHKASGAQFCIFQEVDVRIRVQQRAAYREELVIELLKPLPFNDAPSGDAAHRKRRRRK